jgi:hypothetical protein
VVGTKFKEEEVRAPARLNVLGIAAPRGAVKASEVEARRAKTMVQEIFMIDS